MPTLEQHTELLDTLKKQVATEGNNEFKQFLLDSDFIDIAVTGNEEELKSYIQEMFKHLTEENIGLYKKVADSSEQYANARISQVK